MLLKGPLEFVFFCLIMDNCMMTSSYGHIFGPVNSPHKGPWRGALMFSLTCAWINDWVNNREAGDLRRHRGHYDVNVMWKWPTRSHELSRGFSSHMTLTGGWRGRWKMNQEGHEFKFNSNVNNLRQMISNKYEVNVNSWLVCKGHCSDYREQLERICISSFTYLGTPMSNIPTTFETNPESHLCGNCQC